MRIPLPALAIAGAIGLALGSEARAASIYTDWEFNGGFTDSAGNLNAAPSGATIAPGFIGSGSGSFSGAGQYAETGGNADRTDMNGGFSVLAWVSSATLGTGPILADDKSLGSVSGGFSFSETATGAISIFMRNNADQRLGASTASGLVQAGRWYEVAATWDGSVGGGIQFYLDGAPVASTVDQSSGFAGFTDNTKPFRIGAHLGDSAGNFSYFTGLLDHVETYFGALTPQEIAADYRSTLPVPEPSALALVAGGALAAVAGLRRRGC